MKEELLITALLDAVATDWRASSFQDLDTADLSYQELRRIALQEIEEALTIFRRGLNMPESE